MKETYIKMQDVLRMIDRYGNSTLLRDVLSLNPANVAPIRRGHWMEAKDIGWQCSACKFVSEAFAAKMLYKYCPACGAEMEDER